MSENHGAQLRSSAVCVLRKRHRLRLDGRGTGVLSPKEEFCCRSCVGKGGGQEVDNTEGLRNGHRHQL